MASLIDPRDTRDYRRNVESSAMRRNAARRAVAGLHRVAIDQSETIIGDRTQNGTMRNHRSGDRLSHHMNESHAYIVSDRSRVAIYRDGTLDVALTLAALQAYRERLASNQRKGV